MIRGQILSWRVKNEKTQQSVSTSKRKRTREQIEYKYQCDERENGKFLKRKVRSLKEQKNDRKVALEGSQNSVARGEIKD